MSFLMYSDGYVITTVGTNMGLAVMITKQGRKMYCSNNGIGGHHAGCRCNTISLTKGRLLAGIRFRVRIVWVK